MTTQPELLLSSLKRDWIDAMTPRVLAIQGEWTSDDLHEVLTEPQHPNWLGVLIATLKNSGKVRRVGYRASTRPEANGRVVAIWASHTNNT